jgi:flavin reductase (DIM6/NTAB) family NADH-FMN oxidoreductase RutF
MAIELKQIIPIELNGVDFIIGEIKQIIFPDEIKHESGILDIEKAGSVCISGLDTYHKPKKKFA